MRKHWIKTWEKFVEQRAPRTTSISNSGGAPPVQQSAPGSVSFSVRRQGWATLMFENVQVGAGGNIRQINFTAFSIDETDVGFFGIGSTDETTNPLTLTPSLAGASRYRQFVSNIKITSDPGPVYLTAPAVVIEGTALAHALIDGYGNLTAIVIDDPGFYDPRDWPSAPLVTIAGGATGVATLSNWKVGDFILWNDPVNGYEINEIAEMTFSDAYPYGVTGWTLRRQSDGAVSGEALFGSLMAARTDKPFWRVFPKVFTAAARPAAFGGECNSGLQRTYSFPWPNNCVVAVAVQAFGDGGGGAVSVLNLAPDLAEMDTAKLPLAPGMRLLKGGGYSDIGFLGALAAGDTAIARAKLLDGPHSIRNITADLRSAPAGSDIVLWAVYITPDKSQAGVLDKITISNGSTQSYGDEPRERQMPYHDGWTKPLLDGISVECPDWPPTLIPVIDSPFDGDGNLVEPVSPDSAIFLQVLEDGYIDFVVEQIGSGTPGDDLTVDYRN